MALASCPDVVSISLQDEIQSKINSSCHLETLNIVNATGILNFTTATSVNSIYVLNNPQLEGLAFPELYGLSNIVISPASPLEIIHLPKLFSLPVGIGYGTIGPPTYHENWESWEGPKIQITRGQPSRQFAVDADSLTAIQSLVAVQTSEYPALFSLKSLTRASYLETDACLAFDQLSHIDELRLTRTHGPWSCGHFLPSLRSVGTLNVTGPTSIQTGPEGFAVDKSVIVGPSQPWQYTNITDKDEYNVSFSMGNMNTVGADIQITGNPDMTLDFSGLQSIGGNLNISNNQNCTIHFGNLTNAANISMLDNVNMVLPALLKLENAINIHLRGYIETWGN